MSLVEPSLCKPAGMATRCCCKGFDPSAPPGNGFGIAQVRERLHAAYAELAHLSQLAPDSGGSVTRLQLPITPPMVAT